MGLEGAYKKEIIKELKILECIIESRKLENIVCFVLKER